MQGRANSLLWPRPFSFTTHRDRPPASSPLQTSFKPTGTSFSRPTYDGNTFADLNEGVGYAKQVGFETLLERGRLAAEQLPSELVYAGFSLGVMPAQMLAQTRAGAKGALFFSAALPASEFGARGPPAFRSKFT
jgi:hypothetical protein